SIMTNAWGYTGNTGEVGAWHGNTTCGAWLAQEIMNYFSHTWDKTFLETRGYPMLKSTADFYMEFLTEYTGMDGKTYWVMAPSSSPEHGQIEMMSTMEITVIKDIFTQILKCYDILGKPHDAYYDSVNVKMQALAPYTVMPTGNMAEWQFNPKDDGNTNHRHTSHLLGLFPYAQITPDKTPDLARASLVSMERRFDRNDFEHTEWTAVNAQGMYARLKDGKSAYDYLKLEGDTFTWPNLLSISPEGIALAPCDVYIIDGTFGVAQATDEMLLQSHSDRLEFLPALPKEWSMGNIKGNSAEGAFDVDFTWEDYTLKSAKILSKAGNKVNILKNGATNWSNVSVYKKDGENLTPVEVTSTVSLLSFDTVQGGEYVIMTDDKTELKTGRMINNTDPRIRYSGFNFNAPRVANDYLKDAHYAELADSTIEYEFTGTGFDVIGETDNAGSAFEVYVDGVKHGDGTSLTANPNAAQQTVYSVDGLTYGKHAVKVVKKAGQYLVFDAFRIRGQYFSYINDDSPQITYGEGWSRGTNRDPKFHDFMGDIYYSDNTIKNAVATINFEGTGIELLAEKNGVYGKMEVELDGTVMDTVNQGGGDIPEGGNAGTSVVWAKDGLSNSEHVLKIKNLGDGGWGWISLDGAVVTNDGGADFNAGVYQLNDLKTGELLDVKNNNMVKTLDLEGSAKQKWSMQYADDTYFRLINAYSGKAITINNKSNAVQGDVDLNNQTQLWQIVKCTTKEGGVYLVNKTNSQCLQINGGEYSGDGGSLGLYPYEGFYRKHYKWEMSNAGNGLVMFEN
ncbi:MAG: RICIN domain-containing protein, partial [Oscillospiraceae bacterium]